MAHSIQTTQPSWLCVVPMTFQHIFQHCSCRNGNWRTKYFLTHSWQVSYCPKVKAWHIPTSTQAILSIISKMWFHRTSGSQDLSASFICSHFFPPELNRLPFQVKCYLLAKYLQDKHVLSCIYTTLPDSTDKLHTQLLLFLFTIPCDLL